MKNHQTEVVPADNSVRLTTVIAEDAHFEGNLNLNDGVKVDGNLTGNIQINGEGGVYVGANGSVDGDITAKLVAVEGHVKGKVNAGRLIVFPSGIIEGDIKYTTLRTDEGATLLGSMSKTGGARKSTFEGGVAARVVEPVEDASPQQ